MTDSPSSPHLRVLETKKTMDRHLALMRPPRQLSALILSAFRVLALALAAVGLCGARVGRRDTPAVRND